MKLCCLVGGKDKVFTVVIVVEWRKKIHYQKTDKLGKVGYFRVPAAALTALTGTE